MKTRPSIFLCTIGCFLLATGVVSSGPAGKSASEAGSKSDTRSAALPSGDKGSRGSNSLSVIGQTAGPTPFIANVQLLASNPTSVKTLTFTVSPKQGSVTRPVSALYTAEYLHSRGYFNFQTGDITLPVFGLYANYNNQVTLDCSFTTGSRQQLSVSIQTGTFI